MQVSQDGWSSTAHRAARLFQNRWRAGQRQKSYARRRAAPRARLNRALRATGSKLFTITCEPFNLGLVSGLAATSGTQWLGNAQVPNTVTGGGVNSQNWALAFSLNGVYLSTNGANVGLSPLNNVSEYTALFDSYRIKRVRIEMYYNSNSVGLGASTSLPLICMANDYDDTSATLLPSLQQYDSFKAIQFGNNPSNGCVRWNLKPKIQTVVQTTTGAVVGISQKDTWIDCATPGAEYFGVKGYYDNQNSSGTGVQLGYITFFVKYDVEFKNPK